MKIKQEQIDEIMDHFDFARVAKVMEHLGWEWSVPFGLAVPDEAEIRGRARHMLTHIKDAASVSTGGLRVRQDDGYLSLVFELAGWDTYDES